MVIQEDLNTTNTLRLEGVHLSETFIILKLQYSMFKEQIAFIITLHVPLLVFWCSLN